MLARARRHISYANVAATLALLLAMSGGALAASHYLITSTKQISPKVLKELRGHDGSAGAGGVAGPPGPPGAEGKAGAQGLPGVEGKEGKEGKTGPQGAPGPEGGGAATRWRKTLATAGKSETEATTVVLATVGPFTVTGHCFEVEITGKTFTAAATYIRTSEPGSYAQGYNERGSEKALPVGEDIQISQEKALGLTGEHEANYKSPNDGSWAAEKADGSLALDGLANQGVWLRGPTGPACSFSGFLVSE